MLNLTVRASDKRIACDEDLSDSEDEGDGRRDEQSHKAKRPKVTANGDSKPPAAQPADSAIAASADAEPKTEPVEQPAPTT